MAFIDHCCEITQAASIQHLCYSACFGQSLMFSPISQSSHVTTSMQKEFGRVFVFYTRQPCTTID